VAIAGWNATPRGSGSELRGWHRLTLALWPYPGLALVLVLVAGLGTLGGEALDRATVTALLYVTLVVGLYAFTGLSGVFSFGHVSFMALGALTAALVSVDPAIKDLILPRLPALLADASLSPVAAVVAGGGAAGIFALALAPPLARMSDLNAGLATFAVLVVTNVVLANWDGLTGGSTGIAPVPIVAGVREALLLALLAVAVVLAFQRSSSGLRLRSSREDAVAARSVGVDVARVRGAAFVLSAFVTGAGGALFVMFTGTFTPVAFFLDTTFLIVAMLVVGGVRSLTGAVVGTVVVSALTELLRRVEQSAAQLGPIRLGETPGLSEVALALVLLAILLARPRGLTGGRELPFPDFDQPIIRSERRT